MNESQTNPSPHQSRTNVSLPVVGDGSGFSSSPELHPEELQLALRNREMPLEALRHAVTPAGMHYLLVHYDIPHVDPGRWELSVCGEVSHPLRLDLEAIRRRPVEKLVVTMECAGNGRALQSPRRISQPWLYGAIGTAEWTGTPLRGFLEEAGLRPDVVEVVFTGLDQGIEGGVLQSYQRSLTPEEALRPDVLLAYEMNGQPLPVQHGFPLRLVVPGWYGMTSVKWLARIEAVNEPFRGYQMERGYRFSRSESEAGDPVNLQRVRSLMVPPGIPDFLTRTRIVRAGEVELFGRAWAGRAGISRVEVSTNGGEVWADARHEEPISPHAWCGWRYRWNAVPGATTLCVRATDSQGRSQPAEAEWNWGCYANNQIQRVHVMVE